MVDLGAWPGGWLQVIAERIGSRGRVVGVDVVRVPPLGAPNVLVMEADVSDPSAGEAILGTLGRRADVVLSDLAPKLTGVRATDEARCTALVNAALDLLPTLLRPGGRFMTKLFMGSPHDSVLARMRQQFPEVKVTRPDATRRGSSELYAAATGYLAPSSG